MATSAPELTTIMPVRPSSLPQPSAAAGAQGLPPRIYLRHPGYGQSPDNILLTLPAVDALPNSNQTPSGTQLGLHHRTALTAGAIIANNAFDRAYLTYDQAGDERVDASIPLDGMLEPGDYWLQLRENESHALLGDAVRATHRGDSMPPPLRPALPTSSIQHAPTPIAYVRPSPPPPTASHMPTNSEPYPIVPSFGDWRFPHDKVPSEWTAPFHPPPAPHTDPMAPTPSSGCSITGFRMARNKCHLIPANQCDWFGSNAMARYAISLPGRIDDKANLAFMRADIHLLFDQHRFALVPKPVSLPSGSSGPSQFALAAHVLKDDEESGEFCGLYHNVAVSPSGASRLGREFLFARFAWALFSHVQTFLESPTSRSLAVLVPNASAPSGSHTEQRWMNNDDWAKHLNKRGETRRGSRKRSSSQVIREDLGLADTDADAYEEHRARRMDSLDAEERQIEENTRWYDEAGRFSGGGEPEEAQADENTRWYDNVGRHAAERSEDSSDLGRGRSQSPRRRYVHDPEFSPRPELGTSIPESDGIPNLSRSFTTYGSNRSSTFLEEDRIDQLINLGADAARDQIDPGMILETDAPGDKVLGAAGEETGPGSSMRG